MHPSFLCRKKVDGEPWLAILLVQLEGVEPICERLCSRGGTYREVVRQLVEVVVG